MKQNNSCHMEYVDGKLSLVKCTHTVIPITVTVVRQIAASAGNRNRYLGDVECQVYADVNGDPYVFVFGAKQDDGLMVAPPVNCHCTANRGWIQMERETAQRRVYSERAVYSHGESKGAVDEASFDRLRRWLTSAGGGGSCELGSVA